MENTLPRMIRRCTPSRRLRLSLLQRQASASDSPAPHHQRRRYIYTPPRTAATPLSRSILHSHCRALLLSLSHGSRFSSTMADSSTTAKAAEHPTPHITLTDTEHKIRDILVSVAASIDETVKPSTPTVLRITGGWVRDKLLAGDSNDIDIGINNMTGYEFAGHLSAYINAHSEQFGGGARSVHKIESNPDKSKHLETATTKLLGLDIDFVNLRSETYSEESRIPQMKFGTPTEDALRRDACVNALFYNLMTQQIEDFTSRGLQDLYDRVIRTPLAPYETFKDDPLRVLRLIRFAARLNFTILPDVEAAMMDPDIKEALKLKISRERVGVEIEKMVKGVRAYDALSIIARLKLGDCIFEAPGNGRKEAYAGKVEDARFPVAIEVVRWLLEEKVCAKLIKDERERYVAWLFAAGTPWAGIMGKDGKRVTPVAASGARDGLKLSNRDFESLVRCFGNMEAVRAAAAGVADMSRVQLGHLIRELGSEWRLQVFTALALDIVEKGGVDSEDTKAIVARYMAFVGRVEELGLADAWDLKPLLSGTEVASVLKRKPGKWMKGTLERVVEWQLGNPEGTKDEAREFVTSIAGEIQD
ncbi:hypothetical protein Dda_6156 [Drechslerella dactyloides]|uniref:Poly A polymerase head domain-containing protein n=1 Tax=Drechslerella dactyloides TaxID=74499 RepID=A0AAD6IZI7_DREDA|nr:hypothetical protein Dda_6156 [Drechslerella dactyloides]